MATDAGLKKMWTGAKTTVQTRFKEAEKVWNDAFTQINTRLQGAENDAREFVKRIEEDGRGRLTALGKQLNLEELRDRVKWSELTDQVDRITTETVERLGLVKAEELIAMRTELDALKSQLSATKTKANAAATKSTLTKLTKRVTALEKASKKKA